MINDDIIQRNVLNRGEGKETETKVRRSLISGRAYCQYKRWLNSFPRGGIERGIHLEFILNARDIERQINDGKRTS